MSSPNYYSVAASARPASLSFGQWLVVLLVAVIVAAITAGVIVMVVMGAQSQPFPGPEPMPMPVDPTPIEPVPGDGIDRTSPDAVVFEYINALVLGNWDHITELRHPTERTADGGWANNQGNTPGPDWNDEYTNLRVDPYDWVSADGNWAVRLVYYRFYRDGGPSDDEYSMRLVLKREDGQWYLRLDHWSDDDKPSDFDEGFEGAFGN